MIRRLLCYLGMVDLLRAWAQGRDQGLECCSCDRTSLLFLLLWRFERCGESVLARVSHRVCWSWAAVARAAGSTVSMALT